MDFFDWGNFGLTWAELERLIGFMMTSDQFQRARSEILNANLVPAETRGNAEDVLRANVVTIMTRYKKAPEIVRLIILPTILTNRYFGQKPFLHNTIVLDLNQRFLDSLPPRLFKNLNKSKTLESIIPESPYSRSDLPNSLATLPKDFNIQSVFAPLNNLFL